MLPRQFSLALLLGLVTICCFVAAAAHWLGIAFVGIVLLIGCSLGCVIVGWAAVYSRAPVATKYTTVIGLLGTMLLSLLSLWVSQAREQSRRYQSMDALRRLSVEQSERCEYAPAVPRSPLVRATHSPSPAGGRRR